MGRTIQFDVVNSKEVLSVEPRIQSRVVLSLLMIKIISYREAIIISLACKKYFTELDIAIMLNEIILPGRNIPLRVDFSNDMTIEDFVDCYENHPNMISRNKGIFGVFKTADNKDPIIPFILENRNGIVYIDSSDFRSIDTKYSKKQFLNFRDPIKYVSFLIEYMN